MVGQSHDSGSTRGDNGAMDENGADYENGVTNRSLTRKRRWLGIAILRLRVRL